MPSVQPAVTEPAQTASPHQTRHSHGLDQFCASIAGATGLSILDLGGVSQQNVNFLTSRGHRLHSADFLRTLDAWLDTAEGGETALENSLLRECLNFPERSLDGILAWDALQFLPDPLLSSAVQRIHAVLKPQACLLAFFHADEKLATVPSYSYRIGDASSLVLYPRGNRRRPPLFFNNRGIEKLFAAYHSVKFFLTRDHLREVLVRR